MDIKKVQEIKDLISKNKIESAKAKGVIENIEAEWLEKYGTKDIKEIEKKIAEMENELKASDERLEKLYNNLLSAYDWDKLEEELNG